MKKTLFTSLVSLLTLIPLFAQTGSIRGTITNAITNEPVIYVNVVAMGTDAGTTTDENGKYEITGLAPGLYNVQVSCVGFKDLTQSEIQVTNAKPAVVNFKLEEQSADLQEVVVKASPFKKPEESPLSLRTIGVAEIQRNPGANRDISKVVQTLPGVTSTSSFRNDLIIRGGAPNENRFFLDDVEVPNINHFATQGSSGGPVGMINVNFISEVDFYSGAFPANRGNTLSSAFNFRQPDGRSDKIGASFLLGATDAGMTLEGPIGDKTTFLFSARRSYLQLLTKMLKLPFLPTYNDAQLKVKHKFNQKNELYFVGLGAIDDFTLNLKANDTEEDQFILDGVPYNSQWNYTNGLVYKHYADQGYWTFVVSRNKLNNESYKYFNNDKSSEENLILRYKSQEIENKLRIENTSRYGDWKINYGIGYEFVQYNNRTFNRIFTSAGAQTVDYNAAFDMSKYNGFGQVSHGFFGDRLMLSLGARLDANSYSDKMSNPLDQFSPRFSLSYSITKQFSFNANTGRYYQLPPYTVLGYKEDGVLVNKQNKISYIRADHAVVGFAYTTKTNGKISIEGYYKKYADYPFLLRDSISLANLGGDYGIIGNEPAVSRSAGRSYGIEFLIQQRLFKGFYGIASYTLGKSEFEDKNYRYVPSSWDARHILNLVVGKKFGKNWEVGVKWRYQSGLPSTPFADASALVSNWDVRLSGLPDYSRLNTLRNESSNTIDLRIDKKWFFDRWSLNLYFDIQNLTGSSVAISGLILDRPLDENNKPIGGGIIENPDAPASEQRYKLKPIIFDDGTPLPSVGMMVEF
ncbi:MAG: TonB-dependent receptor plug domain-containing protein [Bacteroidetes bacterium]|nr:TonB-dependent receptor plug domain-containing protein [Bacteroidota bacterium]